MKCTAELRDERGEASPHYKATPIGSSSLTTPHSSSVTMPLLLKLAPALSSPRPRPASLLNRCTLGSMLKRTHCVGFGELATEIFLVGSLKDILVWWCTREFFAERGSVLGGSVVGSGSLGWTALPAIVFQRFCSLSKWTLQVFSLRALLSSVRRCAWSASSLRAIARMWRPFSRCFSRRGRGGNGECEEVKRERWREG